MIQLTKDLAMTADERCYIVGKPNKARCNDVQGGRRDSKLLNPTYHTTAAQAVSAALKRAMRKGVADGSITTLQQFVQEQQRLKAELEKLIAPLA